MDVQEHSFWYWPTNQNQPLQVRPSKDDECPGGANSANEDQPEDEDVPQEAVEPEKVRREHVP